MPRVYLDSDEPYIVSNNNTRVFGGAGTEVIAVQAGVTGLVLDQNIERVSFPGASGDYRYQQAGNQLRVYASNNLMATVPLQGDANGSELVFSNSTVFATIGAGGAISFSAPTSTYNMKVALYSTLSVARGYDATKPLDGLPFDSLTVVVNGSPVKLPLGDKDKIDTFADLKKAVEDALWGNPTLWQGLSVRSSLNYYR